MPTWTIFLRFAIGIVNAPILSWVVDYLHTAEGVGVGIGLLQGSKLLSLATCEEIVVVVELSACTFAPTVGIILTELIARNSQHAQCSRGARGHETHILWE